MILILKHDDTDTIGLVLNQRLLDHVYRVNKGEEKTVEILEVASPRADDAFEDQKSVTHDGQLGDQKVPPKEEKASTSEESHRDPLMTEEKGKVETSKAEDKKLDVAGRESTAKDHRRDILLMGHDMTPTEAFRVLLLLLSSC